MKSLLTIILLLWVINRCCRGTRLNMRQKCVIGSDQLPITEDSDMNEDYDEENVGIGNMKRGVNHDAPIKVIGVGGGASNSIGKMIEKPLEDVEYIILDNDEFSLQYKINRDGLTTMLIAPDSIPNPIPFFYDEVWFNQHYGTDENVKMMASILDQSTKQVIIAAVFGAGMGTLGTMWLAKLYKELNVDVSVVCTVPFSFEGNKKRGRALEAIKSLEESGITVKVIYADDLQQKHKDFNLFNCFSYLDEHVAEAVTEICNRL